MDIWNEQGITGNNATEHSCFEKAFLLVANESGIVKKKFPFETIRSNTYNEVSSIIGVDYTETTKTIFTPFYWLPFVKNAKVEFEDGKILTIKGITAVVNSKKALDNGNGKQGVEIVF